MKTSEIETVKTLWRAIAKYTADDNFSLELDIHRKLLNIFHVGNFYYYVFNCLAARIEFISDSLFTVLGHDRSYFDVENLPALIHPDDSQIAWSLNISKATVDRHRKNMLKKTNSRSTAELSVRSIQENWA
jgi:hypothetical protein